MDWFTFFFAIPLCIVLWGAAVAVVFSFITGFMTIWNARKISNNGK